MACIVQQYSFVGHVYHNSSVFGLISNQFWYNFTFNKWDEDYIKLDIIKSHHIVNQHLPVNPFHPLFYTVNFILYFCTLYLLCGPVFEKKLPGIAIFAGFSVSLLPAVLCPHNKA